MSINYEDFAEHKGNVVGNKGWEKKKNIYK